MNDQIQTESCPSPFVTVLLEGYWVDLYGGVVWRLHEETNKDV